MSKLNIVSASLAAWVVAAFVAWMTLVPAVLSGSTLVLINAAAVIVAVVVLATAMNAQPTRSVHHLLNDAEEPSARPR